QTILEIAEQGERFGTSTIGVGTKVSIEFVSANPTGPLHVGSGRNAAYGDSVARLLRTTGFEVVAEYYLNDTGNQVRRLVESQEARYLQALGRKAEVPEDGYQGDYLIEFGKELAAEHGDALAGDAESLRDWVLERVIESHRRTMEEMRIDFDIWFSEKSLHDSGKVDAAIEKMTELGYTFERDGALWFGSPELGNARDQVLVTSGENPRPVYLAVDIAYMQDKLARGFDKLLYVWGADHHGNVDSMKVVGKVLGAEENLEILLYQLVNFMRGGKSERMGRRIGNIVTLDELLDEVGVDAARFMFVSRSIDSTIDFDFETVKEKSHDNPVYYMQYSHARMASIVRNAAESGVAPPEPRSADLSRLTHESEAALIRKLAEYPEVVEKAAEQRAPHRIVTYLQETATLFNAFYRDCRVLTEDPPLTSARLLLVTSCKTVIRNALDLIGVQAPERM
ncbi:MAG TPA: arginine--tRNA ligase, partial [Actinomycetota bacterium]|nr:arginine--tRNA ligase [Actinomycetota bacterium]